MGHTQFSNALVESCTTQIFYDGTKNTYGRAVQWYLNSKSSCKTCSECVSWKRSYLTATCINPCISTNTHSKKNKKKILSYTYLLVPLAVSPTLLEYSDLILQILIFWILETAESPTKYSLANFHTEAARSAFWTYQFGIWPIELQIQSTFFTSI